MKTGKELWKASVRFQEKKERDWNEQGEGYGTTRRSLVLQESWHWDSFCPVFCCGFFVKRSPWFTCVQIVLNLYCCWRHTFKVLIMVFQLCWCEVWLPASAVLVVSARYNEEFDLEGLVFRRTFFMQYVFEVNIVKTWAGRKGMAILNKCDHFPRSVCACVILLSTLPLYYF